MRAIRALSWIELKLYLREPVTVVFTLALPPLVLYILAEVFGNVPDPQHVVYGGVGPTDYYTPAYIGLVIASLGLIGLPVHVASYRERGVLRRFRAARVPVRALLASQMFVVFVGVVGGAVILVALARLIYGVQWPVSWPGWCSRSFSVRSRSPRSACCSAPCCRPPARPRASGCCFGS